MIRPNSACNILLRNNSENMFKKSSTIRSSDINSANEEIINYQYKNNYNNKERPQTAIIKNENILINENKYRPISAYTTKECKNNLNRNNSLFQTQLNKNIDIKEHTYSPQKFMLDLSEFPKPL